MIGGQYLDITGADADVLELHRLKTGALFARRRSRMALGLADVRARAARPWRAFGDAFGRLFQLVDDLLDGDGAVARFGAERTRDARRGAGGARAARRWRATRGADADVVARPARRPRRPRQVSRICAGSPARRRPRTYPLPA